MRIFAEGWSNDKDGPGQRLVLYLKGCDMRCRWCANPESVSPEKEILFTPERAKGAFDYACPFKAIDGKKLDRSVCAKCQTFDCALKWNHIAFELAGREVSPEQVLKKALDSKSLFGSDGGITFGGGEPTLQAKELLETVALLKKQGISSAIESNASTEAYREVAAAVDYVMSDLKAVNRARHGEMTGISNDLILENLSWAAENVRDLLIRIPLTSGLNDDASERESMKAFLAGLLKRRGSLRVEILRMHHMGAPKWKAIGKAYPMEGVKEPAPELVAKFAESLRSIGIETVST